MEADLVESAAGNSAERTRKKARKNGRRPRSGRGRGLPKTGGVGGKGVRGKLGSELPEQYEDSNDPSYGSENMLGGDVGLERVIPELAEEDVQEKAEPIILEYFENGGTNEAMESFEEFIPPSQRHTAQDAAATRTGDHVVPMGAASEEIIQRGHQHDAAVHKTVPDIEIYEDKRTVERKARGESDADSMNMERAMAENHSSREECDLLGCT